MESVTGMGIAKGRGANWAEAKLGSRGLKANAKILTAAGDAPPGLIRASRFLLTLFLWATSRALFREAVGNSDARWRTAAARSAHAQPQSGPATQGHTPDLDLGIPTTGTLEVFRYGASAIDSVHPVHLALR